MTREFTLKFEVSKANIGDSSIFFQPQHFKSIYN